MRNRSLLLALLLVLTFTVLVSAQTLTVRITGFDTTNFPRVRAFVSVTDPSGRVLETLRQESFGLKEDSQTAKILSVTTSNVPLRVGLLIDRSGSMQTDNRWRDAATAADVFIDAMRLQDEAFVTVFTTNTVTLQNLTSDHALLKNAIPRTMPTGGTALYDAVFTGTLQFGTRQGQSKNILIALTDGRDTNSQKSLAQAIAQAQSAGVAIYTIGLGKDADQDVLQRIATETGGKFYYAPSGEQLQNLYRQIAEVLQKEYAIDFESPRGIPDGTQRRVVLNVTLPGGQTHSGDGTFLAPAGMAGNIGMILPVALACCGGLLLILVAFGMGFVLARVRGRAALAMIALVAVSGLAFLLLGIAGIAWIWMNQSTPNIALITVTPTRSVTPTIAIVTDTPTLTPTVTRTPTPTLTPTSPPSADMIDFAFTADMGNNVRRIYGLREAKKGETPILLTATLNAWHPSIAPNGKLIAFESAVSGVTQIFTMDANGKNVRQLTSGSKPSFQPAFSPDGSRIIFASEREGETKIYVMNVDGSNQRKLGEMPNYNFAPQFSTGLDWITFVSYRDGNAEIYSANADGSNQRRLTNNSVEDESPCFMLGDQILFHSKRSGHLEIYSMNRDGSNVRQLTRHPDNKDNFQPACSSWRFFAYAHIEGTMPHIVIRDMGTDEEWSVPRVGTQGELGPAFRR